MILRGLAVLLALVLLAGVLPPVAHAEKVVLKVGYSDSGGVNLNEDGTYSGYVVDYLNEIAKYTDWEYEYIYDSWKGNSEKLKSGEIDFMVMVRYTEERGEYLLFSELSMAHDYTALYASADSDIYYQDYESFDGCKVAVIEETVFEDSFVKYAQELGLDCELVEFITGVDARNALLRGGGDLFVTSGFANIPDMKLVDRFQLERCYIATGLKNQELMNELNLAMQEAKINNQNLENELIQTHYGANNSTGDLLLTREEQAYLDAAEPVVVKGYVGRRPLGYEDEEGNLIGILPDYLDMLGKISGLEFIYQPAEFTSLEDNAPLMAEEDYVLLSIDQPMSDEVTSQLIYQSDALFDTALAYVRRHGDYVSREDPHTFAVNSALSYVGDMLLETNSQSTVLFFDTSLECMEAVYDGRAEMTILDEHVAAYLLQKPKYADNLTQVAGSELYVDSMCLYAPEEHRYLVSILNKTLESLSSSQRVNAVADSMFAHSYTYQLEDILYEYEDVIRISVFSLVVIIILAVCLFIWIISFRKQKKENAELQEQIQIDELTGAYSRRGFFVKAQEMIEREKDDIYIVRLNVSHFKVVNELYGHDRGDKLLKDIGQSLMEMGRENGFIAGRFTADNFYLCIRREDFETLDFANHSAQKWLGMDIVTTYGVYPARKNTGLAVSAMCDRADLALRSNENATPGYIYFYDDESRKKILREREIENEMEDAVAERQFCIYIQPKYDIESDTIVGGEVLVRWKHPTKGMIPPGEFIGLFEKNGFILKLDYYVWEECCRFISESRKKGLPTYPLSINVSRIHFYGTELEAKLQGLLDKYGLKPDDVELEITESVCAEESDVIFRTCEKLREAGFKIAMDDFGSGYSSLNMLKEMPLDIIKMDLRFLSGAENEDQVEKGKNILRTLIELSHALDLKVVVEGLETESQRDFIRSIGNCAAQGYFYSRPVDTESYEEMIR